ncbi:MAG: FAD-dependent oxidoreductase [Rhizobiaceae bacterium]
MASTYDAIIIGAGVIGAATAFEMAKNGLKTLNVDAMGEAGHGSTSGSCAIIRVYYSTVPGTALAYESWHYWRDWADYLGVTDERGLAEYRNLGCLVMKTELNQHLARHMAICDQLAIPYEEWDEAKVLERLPHYNLERFWPAKRPDDDGFGQPSGGRIAGGVFFPTGGYVTDPALSAHNLQRAAEAHGAQFRFNVRVADILTRDGRTSGVRLASGEEIAAPVVVNVAGPASSRINEMAGVTGDMTISTRALKQEVVHLPAPDGFFAGSGELIVSDSDVATYLRPEKGGNILIGSEDPPCDSHVVVDDPLADDWRNFTGQWDIQAMRQAQRAPTIGIPGRPKGVVDLYDVTEDWIPIYDKTSLPGFYMACGTSGNQYKNAPVAGKMMAALVNYCEAGNDHDAKPLTITMPYTGLDLDIGFFSRKREINQDSSFTVLG